MTAVEARGSTRALVLAPFGRDADVAVAILREAGFAAEACRDVADLSAECDIGAGVALVVEEVLKENDYSALARWIDAQPPWSDFPVVILASRGGGLERNPDAARFTQVLGNVTFLERPFHPVTLVSIVQAALRGRRRQYEARDRLDAVRSAEERFRTLAENIPILCWMARPDGHIFWYNLRWQQYTGVTGAAHEGTGWETVHDPEVLPAVLEGWRRSIDTGEPFEMTFPLRGADGLYRPFLTRSVPLKDEHGRIVRWFGTNTDVSREQKDREHLRLMVNELNHRVKNTLATVQSIIAQTLRGEDIPLRVRDTLTARILALSKAHDVLTDEQWSGADLREIAAQATTPFRTGAGDARITFGGPEIRLPPKMAIAVALALHELATNAVKYGALSTPDGRVDFDWRLSGGKASRDLRMTWREIGGPLVMPPRRAGFGTRLIERGLASDLNGKVDIAYRPEGVVCVIRAKLPAELPLFAPAAPAA